MNAAPLSHLVGELRSSGKDGLWLRKEVTSAEKREPFTVHTPLLSVSFQGLWEGRKEARGLEMGDCMLENGCLAGWEVGVSDPGLEGLWWWGRAEGGTRMNECLRVELGE